MLDHGGKLRAAAQRHGIALADWLDLSTGINPHGWPIPALAASLWQRLPEEEDGLAAVASQYYGAPQVLPVAGSQAALRAMPPLRAPCRVGVMHPAYAEHAEAWRDAGHHVTLHEAGALASAIDHSDVVVLIHPNNPTGARFAKEQLLAWHARLTARGGWLIIDEAFMDSTPEDSLITMTGHDGLIVLRSLGKFFGLAGARVGFVAAAPSLLSALQHRLGPWTVSGPARAAAALALADHDWQSVMRHRLTSAGQRLARLLTHHGLSPNGGCALFQYVLRDDALRLYTALAQQGILVRRFDTPAALRFGLPGDEWQWQRLDTALASIMATHHMARNAR